MDTRPVVVESNGSVFRKGLLDSRIVCDQLATSPILSMGFRLLTLNIQNGQPWCDRNPDDLRIDLEAVGDFLVSQDADVICLQEVERGFDGGLQLDPPPNYEKLCAMLPGYDSVFGYPLKNALEIPFGLGLAVFSRTRLVDFKRVDLPAAPLEFEFAGKIRHASSRLLISAKTIIDDEPIHILNTHLQAFFMIKSSSNEHPEQRNIVEVNLRKLTGAAILAGDMNSAPGETLVEQFAAAGFDCVQSTEPTWRRRPYVVDHIFHNNRLCCLDRRVVHTAVSDHHAVVADFEFARA